MIVNKIKQLGLTIPQAPSAIASYIPAKKTGGLLFISGQLPLQDGKIIFPGKLGENVSIEQAVEATKIATMNAIAVIQANSIDLNFIEIIRLGVFVASLPSFTEHHLVANGASNLLAEIFAEKGKHARFAIGVSSLPLNSCIELELTVGLEPEKNV